MADVLNLRSEAVVGHVDSIREMGRPLEASASIARGAYAIVRGWAVRSDGTRAVDAIRVTSRAAGTCVAAVGGFIRADVARQFDATVASVGFMAAIPVVGPVGEDTFLFEAQVDGTFVPFASAGPIAIVPELSPLAGRPERSDDWACSIDGVFRGGERIESPNGAYTFAARDRAYVKLWAVDRATRSSPASVVACCGGAWLNVIDGFARPDAAENVAVPEAFRCGYRIPIAPPTALGSVLEIYGISNDGSYARLAQLALSADAPLDPRALPPAHGVNGAIDEVSVDGAVTHTRVLAVGREAVVRLRGWAVDERGPRRCGGVIASVGTGETVRASGGSPRADIASTYHSEAVLDAEFVITIDACRLPAGRHRVLVYAVSARGDAAATIGAALEIIVGDAHVPQ